MTLVDRRQILRTTAVAAMALPFTHLARAQALPDTSRIIVGFPPGGAPDIVARRLADALQGKLAKTVIVDNRPGAGGRIAVDVARTAPADGTTLLLNPAGVLTVNPHSYRKLNYDPFKDFAPLSLAAQLDLGLAVGPMVPASVTDLAEFARWSKANPDKSNFGTPAAGSPPHFVGDALARALQIPLTHVPYRGGAPALNELMGGQLAAVVLTLGDMVAHARNGKIRILASTGASRSRFTPAIPTFAEQKVLGLEAREWFGIYIAGTPLLEVVSSVGAMVRAATSSPAYAQALLSSSLEAASSTQEELNRLARADSARWAPIVKASGFVADA